jgi:hypothetical protein
LRFLESNFERKEKERAQSSLSFGLEAHTVLWPVEEIMRTTSKIVAEHRWIRKLGLVRVVDTGDMGESSVLDSSTESVLPHNMFEKSSKLFLRPRHASLRQLVHTIPLTGAFYEQSGDAVELSIPRIRNAIERRELVV